jgi:hypothetical protein
MRDQNRLTVWLQPAPSQERNTEDGKWGEADQRDEHQRCHGLLLGRQVIRPGHGALTGNVQCRGQRNTYKEGHKISLQIQALGATVALSAVTEETKETPGEKADGNFPRFCREFPPSSEGIQLNQVTVVSILKQDIPPR